MWYTAFITQDDALKLAKVFKERLLSLGYPIEEVRLFGSYASNEQTEESDIDIAIVCQPFLSSRHDENVAFLKARRDLNVNIETICLHPEDLENTYSRLAQEIQQHGIVV